MLPIRPATRLGALLISVLVVPPAFAQTVREVAPPQGLGTLPGSQAQPDPSVRAIQPPASQSEAGGRAPSETNGIQTSPAGAAQADSPAAAPSAGADQPEVVGQPEEIEPAGVLPNSAKLTLSDVIASVYQSYPIILQARLEQSRTEGEIVGALGAYDTKAEAYSLNDPIGFYKNYRQGLGFARQTWWGGYLSSGYRLGRGVFPPWYQERPTNEGGEVKLALAQPLLQGRAIDPQRVALFQATIDNRAVDPLVQEAVLIASFEAAALYWEWISAGGKLEAQRELLSLAEVRNEQLEKGVEAGFFPPIDLILNQQLIAERRGTVLEAEQKFRSIAFKLSLYLRDPQGQRLVPQDAWLPLRFPRIDPIENQNFNDDLSNALSRRPEPQLLRLEMSRLEQDRRLANNQLLPQLDVYTEGSKDMGLPTSSKNDKGPFMLSLGLMGEVPIQRRKARGKLQSTNAKIAQVDQKLRLQVDKIATELLIAQNALVIAEQIVEQERQAVTAALETLSRYRFAFTRGKTNLLFLNEVESKANENEIKLIEAQRMWFSALADMQRALGLDPLEQAVNIDNLPASNLPGPGNLPEIDIDSEEFNADWSTETEVPSTQE